MTLPPLQLKKPGLFIAGTDTDIGKTTIACAIAFSLRQSGLRVGVCKPFASGCRTTREGLVSDDAERLAHAADCRAPLNIINPVRYRAPLAPAVAAETEHAPDWLEVAGALHQLDDHHDVMIIEGIGGLMVPLDDTHDGLDLARWLGYPVLVVTRNTLGTLNHTAMTCRLIRSADLPLAGVIINRWHPDSHDAAQITNPDRMAKQNQTRVLCRVPESDSASDPDVPEEIRQAVQSMDWRKICQPSVFISCDP